MYCTLSPFFFPLGGKEEKSHAICRDVPRLLLGNLRDW